MVHRIRDSQAREEARAGPGKYTAAAAVVKPAHCWHNSQLGVSECTLRILSVHDELSFVSPTVYPTSADLCTHSGTS